MEILDLRRLLRGQRREMLCNTLRDAKARINYVALEKKSAWFMETSNIIRNCVTRNVKLAELSTGLSWAANL